MKRHFDSDKKFLAMSVNSFQEEGSEENEEEITIDCKMYCKNDE